MATSRKRSFALAVAVVLVPGLAAANEYSIAREYRADNGSRLNRDDIHVDCQSAGNAGFVFNDMWQGVGNDVGWIEAGTSYCDLGAPAAKWIIAQLDPDTGEYYEITVNYNAGNGTHTWKIINTTAAGEWQVLIDGEWWVIWLFPNGGYSNSADVGLEVKNRMQSTEPATVESGLLAWPTRNSFEDWAGKDWCDRTSSDMSGHWNSALAWRHSLNVSGLSNSSCP